MEVVKQYPVSYYDLSCSSKARLFIFIRNKILKKQKKKKETRHNPPPQEKGGSECWFRRVPGPGQDFPWDFYLIFARYQVLYVHVHIYYSIWQNCYWRGYWGPPPKLFLVFFIQNGVVLGNSNWYTCLDIMPQQEGRLPIYLIRDVQYIVLYIYQFDTLYL